MKKLILSLLIFCSAFASAQISIPQVTGLPAALNSKVDKVTGKSLVADTLSAKIQPHVTNTANPHSTTKAQVGLGNVDNTSDANKPISSATQTALNGKQNAGTYSTDIHSNITALNAVSGTNTGDETLTSIKTKLGAASAVSDGYLTYNMFNIFNGKEPSFTKNTGFNKNFGTTPGTVLEGRTFGTVAGSAVGDFIQNQNSSPQTANMWISGIGYFGNELHVTGSSYPNITVINPSGSTTFPIFQLQDNRTGGHVWNIESGRTLGYFEIRNLIGEQFNIAPSGAATFASTVNSTGFLLNGNNLTSSLTTNYLPKWNGSTFVNATAGTDYQLPITLTTNGTSGAATFSGNTLNIPNYGGSIGSSYSSTITAITGLASATFHNAKYTKSGSVYDASISAHLVTNISSGTCTFRLTLPSTPISSSNLHIWGVIYEQYHAYVVNFWVGSGTSNYQDINFTTSSASGTDFYAILNCKYE